MSSNNPNHGNIILFSHFHLKYGKHNCLNALQRPCHCSPVLWKAIPDIKWSSPPASKTSTHQRQAHKKSASKPHCTGRSIQDHGEHFFLLGYNNSGSWPKQLWKAIRVFLFQNSFERMHFHYSPSLSCPELQIVVLAKACTGPTDNVLSSETPPASVTAILSYTGTGGR